MQLETERFSDLYPSEVFLTFEATKVGCRHGEARVVEEATDVLDRLAGVSAELGSRSTKEGGAVCASTTDERSKLSSLRR